WCRRCGSCSCRLQRQAAGTAHNPPSRPAMLLRCGGMEQPFEKVGDSHYSAILKLSDIEAWWPHTHGAPRLYALTLVSDGVEYPLGRTGFRSIDI
ncbi:hypothetical protein ACC698_37420, partial [Rhizobium johnstonii]